MCSSVEKVDDRPELKTERPAQGDENREEAPADFLGENSPTVSPGEIGVTV